MKTRLIHPALAALTAGLLLTSCSGGSDSDDNADDIDGVQTGEEQTDTPSESASPSPTDDGIDRPEIELPDDMNNVFEDTETGDPTRDAIIADAIGRIEVMDMAFAAGDPGLEAMEFYSTSEALVSARQFVRGSSEDGVSWAGTVVYYDFTVENEGYQADRPVVGYCQDITELRDKNLETGELLPESGGANFLYTQVVMRENELGVWQAERVLPVDEDLDRECER
ncbi:hypothetical protein [Streptomyces sp. B6B3]|uniref:hypothetical protein n=1 Tax=Streptomyces sp. B6B3 TaxID=3153570 RepID=UPI00325D8740